MSIIASPVATAPRPSIALLGAAAPRPLIALGTAAPRPLITLATAAPRPLIALGTAAPHPLIAFGAAVPQLSLAFGAASPHGRPHKFTVLASDSDNDYLPSDMPIHMSPEQATWLPDGFRRIIDESFGKGVSPQQRVKKFMAYADEEFCLELGSYIKPQKILLQSELVHMSAAVNQYGGVSLWCMTDSKKHMAAGRILGKGFERVSLEDFDRVDPRFFYMLELVPVMGNDFIRELWMMQTQVQSSLHVRLTDHVLKGNPLKERYDDEWKL